MTFFSFILSLFQFEQTTFLKRTQNLYVVWNWDTAVVRPLVATVERHSSENSVVSKLITVSLKIDV